MSATMNRERVRAETQLVHQLVALLPLEALETVHDAAHRLRWQSDGDTHVFAQIVCSETHIRSKEATDA